MRLFDWLLLAILISASTAIFALSVGWGFVFFIFWSIPLAWSILTRRRRLERRAALGDLDAEGARNVSKWFWVGPGPGGF